MPRNKPRNQYKKKRSGFYGERPLKKRTELLTVDDVVKENNMGASLSISSNTDYTDFNLSPRNDAKHSDNGSKKTENSRLAYDEVQEDTLLLPLAKVKILMKINLVLLDDTVNGYLTWKNLRLNHLLHLATLKDINSFIKIS